MAPKKKTVVNKKAASKKKTIPRKKGAKKTTLKNNSKKEKPAKITERVDEIAIRMYCHGFGDCFLITFLSKGNPVYRMVIDCGMLTGNSDTLKQAIADISNECGGQLDLVVQTHEHKDHISGFNLKGKDKKLLWDAIEVDNVWLAWTENIAPGGDDLAIDLKEKFKKKKKALAKALGLYNQRINAVSHKTLMESEFRGTDYHSAQQRYANSLQQLLNFYDIGPDEVNKSLNASGDELGLTMKDAMSYFIERNKANGTPHISFWNPGDFANAEKYYSEALRVKPDYYIAYNNRGTCRYEQGKYSEALADFGKAVQINPEYAVAYNNQASVYIRMEKWEEAVKACDKAIELNPEYTEAYFNRGIAKEMLKDLSGACADWQDAFILGSENAEQYLNSPTCAGNN